MNMNMISYHNKEIINNLNKRGNKKAEHFVYR